MCCIVCISLQNSYKDVTCNIGLLVVVLSFNVDVFKNREKLEISI